MQQQPPSKKPKKNSAELSLRGRALRLLGRRELSRQELATRLRPYLDADNPDNAGELDALLDDLAERGWLSDARYAEAVVRRRTGQYARRSIAQLLKRAGVDEEVSASALEKSPENDPDEEFAAALALCQRKFRKTPVEQKEKARQIRFLQSRGYSLGLALRVVKQRGTVHDESEEP